MGKVNWREKMHVTEDQISDLRYAGYSYLRQGKYDIALRFFEALIILDPESSYDAQTIGAMYLETGNPGKALIQFDRALKLEADHAPTLLNLCKAFFMLGRVEEGLKLAHILKGNADPKASSVSRALILAYT
jgi:tetratricopeptide (TPR) repeat protein